MGRHTDRNGQARTNTKGRRCVVSRISHKEMERIKSIGASADFLKRADEGMDEPTEMEKLKISEMKLSELTARIAEIERLARGKL